MSLNNFIPELWEKEFTPKQHFKKLTINIKDNDGGEFGFDALIEIKGGMQIIDAIKDALNRKTMGEGYPKNWKHCVIHLNPETGEMHSDGDHSVRGWIQLMIEGKQLPNTYNIGMGFMRVLKKKLFFIIKNATKKSTSPKE